jgi:hypothetical protein
VLARLPNNHGLYPYGEAVLINCRLTGIPPAGWGPIDDDTSHIHFWSFTARMLTVIRSMSPSGTPSQSN